MKHNTHFGMSNGVVKQIQAQQAQMINSGREWDWMSNLETHDMVGYWVDRLDLMGWTIATKAIEKKSVTYADDVPDSDKYFVGIQIDKESMQAIIYHDRPLTDEYVVHELLHVKYPNKSESWVNEIEELITTISR